MRKGMIGILSTMFGAILGGVGVGYIKNKTIAEKTDKVDKFKSYYNMLNQWLVIKNEGNSLEKYFTSRGYKSIAIYGMGEMGNRLLEELKDTSIDIKYAIDKNAESTYTELEIFGLDDTFELVDAIVVTAIFAFSEIEDQLRDKADIPIISLEDVVYEM